MGRQNKQTINQRDFVKVKFNKKNQRQKKVHHNGRLSHRKLASSRDTNSRKSSFLGFQEKFKTIKEKERVEFLHLEWDVLKKKDLADNYHLENRFESLLKSHLFLLMNLKMSAEEKKQYIIAKVIAQMEFIQLLRKK